jgi:hypothetical protein
MSLPDALAARIRSSFLFSPIRPADAWMTIAVSVTLCEMCMHSTFDQRA